MAMAAALLLLLSTLFAAASSDLSSDRAALLALRSAVGRSLKWNASNPSPCFWPGVTCSPAGAAARVTELHLPGVYLFGPLPAGALGNLTALLTLSLRLNRLSGPLPDDLGRLSALRNLYLQGNSFSGEIPPAIFGLTNLVRLNLASNNFSGRISPDFANLTRLATLYLENNRFSGSLPNLPDIAQFNVSNNRLTGAVPASLSGKKAVAFSGNNLCGGPLAPCPGQQIAPAPDNSGGSSRKKHKGLSGGAIAGIVIGSVVALLGVLLLLFVCCCRGKSSPRTRSVDLAAVGKPPDGEPAGDKPGPPNGAHYASAAAAAAAAAAVPVGAAVAVPAGAASKEAVSDAGAKRLIFFGSAAKVFDLEDLLRASAEVLGKGTFGTAYKAALEMGMTVAVKRLKDVTMGKGTFGTAYKAALEMGMTVAVKRLKDVTMGEREFREKIESVGSMEHDNLVPLRAYYYSKDEKLLVYDFLINGSLSALLHGNRGAGRTPLNWDARSGIALGVAKGIEYLHNRGPHVSHGNIKSSNVLLTKDYDARVSDFGLAHLVGPTPTPNRVAGYRAPEVTDTRRVSQKADVYSFGVLLLELLTGKAPTHSLLNEEGIDLPRWVQSVVKEEWASEVFDLELLRYQNVEEEMVQLLQLAMDCCAQYPDHRPSMQEAVRRIEELRQSSMGTGHGPPRASDEGDNGLSRRTFSLDGSVPPATQSSNPFM